MVTGGVLPISLLYWLTDVRLVFYAAITSPWKSAPGSEIISSLLW